MASAMDQINAQLKQLQNKVNKLVEQVKNWPQYRQIGAGIIILGLLLLIIGILIY